MAARDNLQVRGFNRQMTYWSPDVRRAYLQQRIPEIEAWAGDRQLDPSLVTGFAEACMRLGRAVEPGLYGFSRDDGRALVDFVREVFLNTESKCASDNITEAKEPAKMTAGQINKERAKLGKQRDEIVDALIDAGRGHELHSETMSLTDPLARKFQSVQNRWNELSIEMELRAGPDATRMGELPRSFGPRHQAEASNSTFSKPAINKSGLHEAISIKSVKFAPGEEVTLDRHQDNVFTANLRAQAKLDGQELARILGVKKEDLKATLNVWDSEDVLERLYKNFEEATPLLDQVRKKLAVLPDGLKVRGLDFGEDDSKYEVYFERDGESVVLEFPVEVWGNTEIHEEADTPLVCPGKHTWGFVTAGPRFHKKKGQYMHVAITERCKRCNRERRVRGHDRGRIR